MLCIEGSHHINYGRQRVQTVLAFLDHVACFRATWMSAWLAYMRRDRWGAAMSLWRQGALHPLLNPYAFDMGWEC